MTVSKLPGNEGSIFATIGALAAQYGAVNLSQGFPDFEPDGKLLEALGRFAQPGNNHQYSPPEGIPQLREAICSMLHDLYDLHVDPYKNMTVTAGATQAIFTTLQALIHAGDEVIIFEPGFECYEPAVRLAGGVPIAITLSSETYLPAWDVVQRSISAKTKLIIINNPHNPSGTCWPLADLKRLGEIAVRYNLIVLSDEVYHNIVFAPNRHIPSWLIPGLAERTVMIGSLGKTLHVTGWRLGYAITPARLTAEFRKIHQFLVYAAPTPLQHAMAAVLGMKESYSKLSCMFQSKRDRFLAGLQGSRFRWNPSEGTYFQLVDYKNISEENDRSFANWLIQKHRIAAIPISGFHSKNAEAYRMRFCFAKRDETLDQATSILRAI